MVGSSKVLSIVYIRTSHLTKHSYNCFEESKNLTKTTVMKEVIEEKKVFRSEILTKKEVHDEIQRSVYFIKDELQSVIEKIYRKEAIRKICIGCMLMDLDYCLL